MIDIKKVVEGVKTTSKDTTLKGSNLIEPTETMIEAVCKMTANGDDLQTIKRTVKKGKTNLTLSYSQIADIQLILNNKNTVDADETGLALLSDDGKQVLYKCEVCGKYPCECKLIK